MSKYQAYSEYKDSEVEWLGNVPSHWDVFYGKRIFNTVRKKALETDEQLAASQKFGVIPQALMMQLNDSKVMLALKGTESFRHVDKNNFVISLRSFEGGIEHSNYIGCVSPAYTVLTAVKNIEPKYFKYLLKSASYITALQASTDSLRDGKSISFEQFGNIELPLMAVEEQTQIAAFLDHETAKIDTLIEKQQQLIELLKEKRQAVISHAVTKGLNPDAPMKDSGVEWLGEVPAHWGVGRFKWITRTVGRIGYRGYTVDDIVDEGEGAIVLSPSNINDRGFSLTKKTFLSWKKYFESPEIMVESGDILLAKTSWSFGKVAVITETSSPMTINPQMVLLKDAQINPYYLWCLLSTDALQCYIFNSNSGSYMPTMSQESIGNLPALLPPPSEVSKIIDHIKKQTELIDLLIDKQHNIIKLLHERRTALISAAVTGKIDVRHFTLEDGVAPTTTSDTNEAQQEVTV